MQTEATEKLIPKQFKLSPQDLEKLERMAKRIAGGNQSNVLRQLIRQADEAKLKGVYEMQAPHPG